MTGTIRSIFAAALVAGLCVALPATAGVVIQGTRVVYPSQDKEVTVKLSNEGKKPALVQFWLDDGDEKSTPETARVPFTSTPPIFRLEPGKGQAVRVMQTGQALPADKESLFWVNVLEVPPKADDAQAANRLQFAFRTRIKLFYRPQGLAGNVADAPGKLAWRWGGSVTAPSLVVSNPTPYHVNFASMSVSAGGKTFNVEGGGMVAPNGEVTFTPKGLASRDAKEVSFQTISDYGAVKDGTAPIGG
jgi:chaperone protein EcpD